MKAELVKKLHEMGIYRDPKTKQKLELMKVADIIGVLNFVEEEMEKGVVFERKQCAYEFVKPQSKKDKVVGKGKKSR